MTIEGTSYGYIVADDPMDHQRWWKQKELYNDYVDVHITEQIGCYNTDTLQIIYTRLDITGKPSIIFFDSNPLTWKA